MANWQTLVTLATPILTLCIGILANRRFENCPKLLSYWGHVSSFSYQDHKGTTGIVNTHSVVIRNVGRRPATNVRLSHAFLPNFNLHPPVPYTREVVPNAADDIVIPTVVPNQQLTISYLYYPPNTYERVNAGIRYDEGIATQIPVLIQRQYPRWVIFCQWILMITGACTLTYALVQLAPMIVKAMSS